MKIIGIVGIAIVVMLVFPTNVFADPRPYAHYHYEQPQTPYYQEPYHKHNDDFVLIVRLQLSDKHDKYDMPDFYVYAGGEKKRIHGEEFEDDGKAKVIFDFDRDDLSYKEDAIIKSVDGKFHGDIDFIVNNYNQRSIKFRIYN